MKKEDIIFSQLADVKTWAISHGPVNRLDFVALEGKPSLLLAYSALLDPPLEEVEGRYFLATGFSSELLSAWADKGVTGADAQRVINHIHMQYIMQGSDYKKEVLNVAAKVIRDVWNKTLPKGAIAEIIEEGTPNVAVTFFQVVL